MKKTLLALLISAGVSATAMAQSNVTVYGILDVNVTSSKTDGAGANTAMSENALSTSRLGFTGSEDLGGGLKAEFQLESKLVPSTGTVGANTSTSNTLFNRESWVGLNSKTFGAVRMGLTDVTDVANIDINTSQAGNLGLFTTAQLGVDKAKVIRYTTPKFAGLSAQFGYANPDSTTTAEVTANSIKSVLLQYEAGKLVAYAGTEDKNIDGTFVQKNKTVGAKYDFGFASVGGAYSVRDGATQVTADTGELKQTRLSVAVPLSSGYTVHGVYGKSETSTEASTDHTVYKLAVSKAFSKRTTAYAAHVSTNNVGSTADTQTTIVGVRHSF